MKKWNRRKRRELRQKTLFSLFAPVQGSSPYLRESAGNSGFGCGRPPWTAIRQSRAVSGRSLPRITWMRKPSNAKLQSRKVAATESRFRIGSALAPLRLCVKHHRPQSAGTAGAAFRASGSAARCLDWLRTSRRWPGH